MNRYDTLFADARAAGRGVFVPFVMLGDPTPAVSLEIVRTLLRGGADALELGIPFSDPIADGPTIQAAALRALSAGVRVDDCWAILKTIRAEAPAVPVGLLVYANLVVGGGGGGVGRFYGRARDAGVDSVLIADVPSVEAAPFVAAAAAHQICPVLIAPPNADEKRLGFIAKNSRGYTYVVSRAGVTGADDDLRLDNAALLRALKRLGAPPALLGFGISRPDHVRAALAIGAAGAISGSAVVAKIPAHAGDPAALCADLEAFVREMAAAAHAPAGG